MIGFFKRWAANASEHRGLQKELTVIFAEKGVNFMQLHPEITKCLVGLAREESTSGAAAQFDEMYEMVTTKFPDLTIEQRTQQLVGMCKTINTLAQSNKLP